MILFPLQEFCTPGNSPRVSKMIVDSGSSVKGEEPHIANHTPQSTPYNNLTSQTDTNLDKPVSNEFHEPITRNQQVKGHESIFASVDANKITEMKPSVNFSGGRGPTLDDEEEGSSVGCGQIEESLKRRGSLLESNGHFHGEVKVRHETPPPASLSIVSMSTNQQHINQITSSPLRCK